MLRCLSFSLALAFLLSLLAGCSGPKLIFQKGEKEELEFLKQEDKVLLQFDYSKITVLEGEKDRGILSEEVYLKNKSEEYRRIWQGSKDSLYEWDFEKLFVNHFNYRGKNKTRIHRNVGLEETNYIIRIEPHKIYILPQRTEVRVDFKIKVFDKNKMDAPLSVFRMDYIHGRTIRFKEPCPEANAIKNTFAVVGRELARYID